MLLSCVIKAITTALGSMVSEERNLRLIVTLDIRFGKVHFVEPSLASAHFLSDGNTNITLQIGGHEYRLGFNGKTRCVKERSLVQCDEDFLSLFNAQRVLGLSGTNTIH